MDRSRALALLSVGVVLGVTVASGPVVGVVDLTTPRLDTDAIGQGTATVDAVDAPETARFDRAVQSESYVLRIPDARIHIADIEGGPVVSYTLSIPEMGYSRTTTHFLDGTEEGWVTLSVEPATLGPDMVTQSSYDGELSIVLRGDEERVLLERNVTAEVSE